MQIVSRIFKGHKIETIDGVFEVLGSQKFRSGHKYICSTKTGQKVTLDREDVLQAQRDCIARVVA